MRKKVLDVGQCSFDHASIARQLQSAFGAVVRQADDWTEALDRLQNEAFHLILVNRKLDCDGGDGIRLICSLKQQREYAGIPTMLVSNYAEAQRAAVAAGAVPGFGKAELGSDRTLDLLRNWLADDDESPTKQE